MSHLANLPSAISLVLKGTTCGQQQKNRNPETFLLGQGDTVGAMVFSVQPFNSEISGRLLSRTESKRSQIQPRCGSEISSAASIVSLPSNTLPSPSESFC